MSKPCYLKIQVNGQETFFLNEKIVTTYSGAIRKMIRQEKRRTQTKKSGIELNGFPGGPAGFELVSRFCHNNGRIRITVSNVSLLHCCALFLGMTEKLSPCNLLQQTDEFLEGLFYWSSDDIMVSLKSCEPFIEYADSSTGLVQKLICALMAKIAQNSDMSFVANSSSSSSSSPDTASGFRFSSYNTPESIKFKPGSSDKAWWFNELTVLPPIIIELVVKAMGGYGDENNSLVLTKFLLHYLKTASHKKGLARCGYGGLAETAVKGVILVGKTAFSCRGLFWVLRVLSGFGLRKDCRDGLERVIGGVLDQATLDDLLVSGHDRGVYDVNLVSRLLRLFVHSDGVSAQKMKKVGRLIDKYLGEIAPDQNLKISKFLAVAESLPDSARSCSDGLYRSIDIYLESHPSLSFDERSRLCRCLNYSKLTLEACKDLAKNPRIPPGVAVQALMSQQQGSPKSEEVASVSVSDSSPKSNESRMVLYKGVDSGTFSDENEDMRLNLQKMQWRVKELEKICRNMKGQMSKMVKHNVTVMASSPQTRALPRLC